MYLLDTSVLITASNNYYELLRVPEYWDWMLHQCQSGKVKVPEPVYQEVVYGQDDLSEWAKDNSKALILNEPLDQVLFDKVISEGYSLDLGNKEVENIGADTHLIAYGLVENKNRTVVTLETKNNKVRQNRSIPSVCEDLGVNCCDPFEFGRKLNFSTKWKDNL